MFSNPSNNTAGTGLFGNKPATGTSPAQGQGMNIFSNPPSGGSLFGGNNPQPAQQNQTTNILQGGNQPKPASSIFGGGGQAGQQPAGSSPFGNAANTSSTPTGTNNLFGNTGQQAAKPGGVFNNPTSTTNQPAGTGQSNQGGGNLFRQGSQGVPNTGGLFSNQANTSNTTNTTNTTNTGSFPTTSQPPNPPKPEGTGNQPTANLFSNTTTTGNNLFAQQPTNPTPTAANTPATGTGNAGSATTNIFGMNKPAETTNPPPTTAPQNPPATGGGLFTNKPSTSATGGLFTGQTGQGGQTSQAGGQAGQTVQGAGQSGQSGQTGGNLFSNQSAGQAGGSGQPASSGGQTGTTNIFGNPGGQTGTAATGVTGVAQSQDDIEAQFDRSNKTVAEFISECRSTFLNTYEDLQKMCDSTLKYLNERQENQKIAKNFAALEPLISNKSEYVLRTLEGMEKQQDQIERAIEMMSKRLGEGRYTHELSEHIEEYEVMKEEIMKLQEDAGEWNDPGNQQLMNIFENLNQIESQIREMDQIADIYMNSFGFN